MNEYSTNEVSSYLKNTNNILIKNVRNIASDLLANSDFISRTIGMTNSYEDIMLVVQALGREPLSLLGKDYLYIFDHVRRNYQQGKTVTATMYGGGGDYWCPKFTFYNEVPTVRFADPYNDSLNLLSRWASKFTGTPTKLANTNYFYAESNDGNVNNKVIDTISNTGTQTGQISKSFQNFATCDLIKKTNDNFVAGKYRTLIARFHTSKLDTNDPTQTAVSENYGMSHGRNLLKKKDSKNTKDVYDNPYCRVWTYHHQYHTLNDAIRPFGDIETADDYEKASIAGGYDTIGFRTSKDDTYGTDGGSERLDKHGVLNYRNGFVNIAPTAKIVDYVHESEDEKDAVSIKKCMFSIENLAWRDKKKDGLNGFDEYGLSAEQRGPFGGRIMWFPPYDINFNENVSVKWNSNEFIGRGENIYTYTNTERRGNLSFTLLVDHPSVLDYWAGRDDKKLDGEPNKGGIDGDNQENTLLRFFAGCEVLTAKPQKLSVGGDSTERGAKDDEKTGTDNDNPVDPDEAAKKGAYKIICFLYFPNNYSGKDEKDSEFAINYLMNGIGTQNALNEELGEIKNIDIDMSRRPTVNGSSGNFGGYEVVNGGSGISITTKPLKKDQNIRQGTYHKKSTTNEHKENLQYLTDEDGNRYTVSYGNGEFYLLKIIGESCKEYKTFDQWNDDTWHKMRWYYRVDEGKECDLLTKEESYIDTKSYGLNGNGYRNVTGSTIVTEKQAFKEDDNTKLISFTTLYTALKGKENVVSGYGVDDKDVELITALKDSSNGHKLKTVKFIGFASRAGDAKENEKLAESRAATFAWWIINTCKFAKIDQKLATKTILQDENSHVNNGEANGSESKMWRSAMLEITYDLDDTKLANKDIETSVDKDATGEKVGEEPDKPNSDVVEEEKTTEVAEEDTQNVVRRYDNEGEFFELLTKDKPFLHHLITDKIKYFDPAYHAISPEGFNARLTFLHQCTRQGATIGNSDMNVQTAYNLAFGRPPICVLRLGDFFYTKIVINSLTITYDEPQWDLNPEGIGVMPMFAKVNLDFTFIGGSDLAGPIARLQNAVSFNYYANTSVYDNRAEVVEYKNDGSGKESSYKPFNYPNDPGRKTAS